MHKDNWTDRQVMLGEIPFEYYHYLDEIPPSVESHQHPFYELFFFLGGNVNYTIEGKIYKLRPGDILLTNSHDVHRPEILPGAPYERVVIWISDDLFEYLPIKEDSLSACFRDAATKNYRLIRPEESHIIHLRKTCARMERAMADSRVGSLSLQFAYLFEFLVEVCRCYYETAELPAADITENNKINTVIAYLNDHIAEELTLDSLSETFYISKFYLSKQFREYTGTSIYQYIMKKRLTVARDLLRAGAPVTQAYLECGFGDYSNFLKAFKREFGCTPKTYRG